MTVPSEFRWLLDPALRPLPRVVQVALRELGVREVVGKGSNDRIMKWRDELNAAGHRIVGFSDDDIPWCGLFIAYVTWAAGKGVVESPLWARNWAKFGTEVATRRNGKLEFRPGMQAWLGDVLVFERPGGGGHVDIYIAETPTMYVGIGGNKSNRVQISPILKSRCIAIRRPPYSVAPKSMRPFHIKSVGALPTSNEA